MSPTNVTTENQPSHLFHILPHFLARFLPLYIDQYPPGHWRYWPLRSTSGPYNGFFETTNFGADSQTFYFTNFFLCQVMPPVLRSASKAKEGAPNKSRIADQRIEPRPKKKLNFVRNKADFVWIALMMGVLVVLGEHYFPHRTPESQQVAIYEAFNVGGAFLPVGTSVWHRAAPYAVFFLMTGVSLSGLTLMLYFVMQYLRPRTSPQTFEFVLSKQLKTIFFNLAVLLPAYQTFWEWLVNSGYTKVTIDRLSPFHIVGDIFLWVLAFELLWYAQHRAMHDSKTLWKFGHEYHHSWRQPEHMIGVTNFAFDALVEGWVTMSSSFLPVLVFPINWYAFFRFLAFCFCVQFYIFL